MELNTLLVPVDFSPTSEATLAGALEIANGKKPLIIVMHVIDSSLAEFARVHGLGSEEDVIRVMRQHAERQLADYKRQAQTAFDIQTLVSEGVPFLEILKKAEELLVDAIVMGNPGAGRLERLLFGSTAERVLRGSRRPVIVLPVDVDA